MNIAFAGFRHSHIIGLYDSCQKEPTVHITGCYEKDDSARITAASHSIEFNYNSYEDILNDKNVDAVAIGDYYGIRGQMVIKALKAGKHVICDKPICTQIKELDEIEALVAEKNLQVCCMLDLRYMPQISKVCEIIKSGGIGEVLNISFTGQHYLDYGNRPAWYFEAGKHGGTINDIAIHGIDLIRFITGENLSEVKYAGVRNAFAIEEPHFEDSAHFIADFGNIRVMGDVSYAAPGFDGILPTYWDFYFWGTEGMINFNYKSGEIRIYKKSCEIIECEDRTPGYLGDFMEEISGEKTMMNTQGILKSQRQALEIQRFADESN